MKPATGTKNTKHQEIKFHPFKRKQKKNVAIDINRQSGFTHQNPQLHGVICCPFRWNR
jgi:hypothetical protein